MLKLLLARGWKGFITRYISILLVVFVIGYMIQNTDTIFPTKDQQDMAIFGEDDAIEQKEESHELDDLHDKAEHETKEHGSEQEQVISSEEEIAPALHVDYRLAERDLHLTFRLSDFELSTEAMDGPNQEGEGHLHLYIDGEKVTKIFEPSFVWKDLEPGTHHVKVEMAHNNHDPYGIFEEFVIEVE